MKQMFSRQLSLPKPCVSSIRMSSSPKVLDLDIVAAAAKHSTIIMVTLLRGRVLCERALAVA